MLDKVKLALRITHTFLDDAIEEEISEARADMIRSGVDEDVANNDSYPATASCVKTYCLYRHASKEDAERYWESYQYQVDCMRKSTNLVVNDGGV